MEVEQVLPEPNEAELAEITALLKADEPATEVAPQKAEQEEIPNPAGELEAGETEPKPAETAKPETAATESKPESKDLAEKDENDPKLSKYEKARVREAKAWKKIEQEKAEVARERAEIAKLREQSEYAKQAKQSEPEPTPEQWDALAKRYEQEGKFEFADAAKRYAEESRQKAAKAAQASPPKSAEFVQLQRSWWEKAKAEHPDVVQKGAALNQAVLKLIESDPSIKDHPKGFYFAVKLAANELQAGLVSNLQKEAEQLRAENQKLKAQTEVSSAGTAVGLPRERTFDQMNTDEQEAYLRRHAAGTPMGQD